MMNQDTVRQYTHKQLTEIVSFVRQSKSLNELTKSSSEPVNHRWYYETSLLQQ